MRETQKSSTMGSPSLPPFFITLVFTTKLPLNTSSQKLPDALFATNKQKEEAGELAILSFTATWQRANTTFPLSQSARRRDATLHTR